MSAISAIRLRESVRQRARTVASNLRLSGLQGKLIIPYVLLTLILAATGIYIITRLVTSTLRERFVNQLYEAARVASDGVVRQERIHLENLRLAVYMEGVSDAVGRGDAQALSDLLLPFVLNSSIDSLTAVNLDGIELLTLGRDPASGKYVDTRGTDFSDQDFVRKVLEGQVDTTGDKYVGLMDTSFGPGLFTSAPVSDSSGKLVGSILIGTRLENFLTGMKTQALADMVLLGQERQMLATTLTPEGKEAIQTSLVSIPTNQLAQPQDLEINQRPYQMTFTPLMARGESMGYLGVILPSKYVVSAEATSRDIFSLIFTLGTVAIIVIGFVLSQSIARPILKLHALTQAVASGNLEQNIGIERSDEIGELASAFDVMTLRLRERTQEAARLYSEAVQRNRELAETNARLKETQRQLIQSEKLAAIGQLTAGIVHDVKNPLTVIKGVAELMLAEGEIAAEVKEELSLIRESALKANDIVSDLMKFARQSKPEMDEHDLRETVEAALRLTAYPLRKAHVQLVKDIPEEPVAMTYDDQQIEQVLVNLIHNAAQAMPEGGTLRVNLTRTNGVAAIAVQDTGIGIPAENLDRIFDPFFTTKPEGEGTGLGLSVSYGIISNHEGHIDVESIVGEGTTFTVLLPVKTREGMLVEV